MATPSKVTKVINVAGGDGPVESFDPEPDDQPAVKSTPAAPAAPAAPASRERPKPRPLNSAVTTKPLQLPRNPLPVTDTRGAPEDAQPDPLPVVTVGGRKVAILCPIHKSTNPLTLYSLMATWDRAAHGFMLNYGDAFVIHSRNRLAERFLETPFEWALFVDDDMILPCGNAKWFKESTGWTDFPDSLASVKVVDRLVSHGKDVVGALYFGRNHRGVGKPMFAEGLRSDLVAKEARNLKGPREIRPTAWLGTGCLLVHRRVFESIKSKFLHLAPTDPAEPFRFFSPAPDGALSRLISIKAAAEAGDLEAVRELAAKAMSPESMVNAWSGEDVVFTNRARMSGFQPYVDFGCVCGHVGSAVWGPSNTA